MVRVLVYSVPGCRHCKAAKSTLADMGVEYSDVNLSTFPERRDELTRVTGVRSVPQIFVGGHFVGGNDGLTEAIASGRFAKLLEEAQQEVLPASGKPSEPWLLTTAEYVAQQARSGTGEEAKAADAPRVPTNAAFIASPALLDLMYTDMMDPGTGVAGKARRSWFGNKSPTVTGRQLLDWVRAWLRSHRDIAPDTLPMTVVKSMFYSGMVSAPSLAKPFQADGTRYVLQGHVSPKSYLITPATPPALSIMEASHYVDARTRTDGSTKLPSPSNSAPVNMAYVYTGPTKRANVIAADLRTRVAALFDEFLSHDGKAVRYGDMAKSVSFAEYVRTASQLQRVNLFDLTLAELQAFFINVYNALALHGLVLFGHPHNSRQRWIFYSHVGYRIGPFKYSLNDIEHGMLRGNTKAIGHMSKQLSSSDGRLSLALPHADPRIHFTLVCGAKSCPPLAVYHSDTINEELNTAAQVFVGNDDNVSVDVATNTVTLSSLFNWYGEDFGNTSRELLMSLLPYTTPETATALTTVLSKPKFTVKFSVYNWSPNE